LALNNQEVDFPVTCGVAEMLKTTALGSEEGDNADWFAELVLGDMLSLAEIQDFLLRRKIDPDKAVD
jgi:hypothetical protein